MGEASIKVCRGLERVYNEIGRDLSANLLTISTDRTRPIAIDFRLVCPTGMLRLRPRSDVGLHGPSPAEPRPTGDLKVKRLAGDEPAVLCRARIQLPLALRVDLLLPPANMSFGVV
jgi:hypothetical protein